MPDAGLGAEDRGAYVPCLYTWKDGCRRELGEAKWGLLLKGWQPQQYPGLSGD